MMIKIFQDCTRHLILQDWMMRLMSRVNMTSNMSTFNSSMILHMKTWMNKLIHMGSNMSRNTMEKMNPMNATTPTVMLIHHNIKIIMHHKNTKWMPSRNHQKP